MTNNDVLRRIRFIFDFNDRRMMTIFSHGGADVSRAELSSWLKKDDDPDYQILEDPGLSRFLNGLIIEKRGKKEGAEPEVEARLTNNIILKKLRIALDMQSDDVINTLASVNQRISKSELSAFFRKPNHKHYRKCQDQILRKFIHGAQLQLRPDVMDSDESAEGLTKEAQAKDTSEIVKPAKETPTKYSPAKNKSAKAKPAKESPWK